MRDAIASSSSKRRALLENRFIMVSVGGYLFKKEKGLDRRRVYRVTCQEACHVYASKAKDGVGPTTPHKQQLRGKMNCR